MPSAISVSPNKHNVTIYTKDGSQTIKDPNNSPTQCALKTLVDTPCSKSSNSTKYRDCPHKFMI
ncbi:MAG: hypothetical protein RLZZ210_1726 [Pseudomonadota bacterium]|jgi:hypothetical protein